MAGSHEKDPFLQGEGKRSGPPTVAELLQQAKAYKNNNYYNGTPSNDNNNNDSSGQRRRSAAGEDDDEDEREETSEEELILTKLHGSVYDMAFGLTVRGMRDKRAATVLVALMWVFMSVTLVMLCLAEAYANTRFSLFGRFADKSKVYLAQNVLRDAIATNQTLDQAHHAIVAVCDSMPSLPFFCLTEFLLCIYLYGNLAALRHLAVQIWNCPVVKNREETAEERPDKFVVTGLMPHDAPWMTALFVVPKFLTVAFQWYVGSAFLSYSRRISSITIRACMIIMISQVDKLVFESFISASKKEWVQSIEVVIGSGRMSRYAAAWPGEIAKLISISLIAYASCWFFSDEVRIRGICWECMTTCSNHCSDAFDYCKSDSFIHMVV